MDRTQGARKGLGRAVGLAGPGVVSRWSQQCQWSDGDGSQTRVNSQRGGAVPCAASPFGEGKCADKKRDGSLASVRCGVEGRYFLRVGVHSDQMMPQKVGRVRTGGLGGTGVALLFPWGQRWRRWGR